MSNKKETIGVIALIASVTAIICTIAVPYLVRATVRSRKLEEMDALYGNNPVYIKTECPNCHFPCYIPKETNVDTITECKCSECGALVLHTTTEDYKDSELLQPKENEHEKDG